MGRLVWIAAFGLAVGCAARDRGGGVDSDGTTSSPAGPLTDLPGTSSPASTGSVDPSVATTGGPTDPFTGTTTTPGERATNEGGESSTSGPEVPDVVLCAGAYRQCGDGEDNDGDGLYDQYDRECTGPCDDNEGSFEMDLPGEGSGCERDCAFDGNADQTDDHCRAFLPCDVASPGEALGCPYDPPANCQAVHPDAQSQQCTAACMPLVPPGCDCFGCCILDSGPILRTVFMDSGDDCRFDNLAACQSCTPSIDCFRDCDPDCERCFGIGGPPPICDPKKPPCGDNDPCSSNADCPTDWLCYLGCCYPPPPSE